MSKSFFIVTGIFALTIALVNIFVPNPRFTDLKKKADNYTYSNRPKEAETCYLQLIQRAPDKIDNHYDYVQAHYSIPKKEKIGKDEYEYRDDTTIKNFYASLAEMPDSLQHDIGYYCMGLCSVEEKDYEYARIYYDSVFNRKQKYLNNSIGYIFLHNNDLLQAEKFFKTEIENNGSLDNAYSNLAKVFVKERKLKELNKLLENEKANKSISYRSKRLAYFLQANIVAYWTVIFRQFAEDLDSLGFLSAFIILLIWLYYFRQIDVYEKEKWKYIILTCCLGMLFSFGTFIISDTLNEYIHFRLNGGVGNDFVYSVFGIGAVEELMKIIPLLLLLGFTNQINEPIDYIIYASVSALGFAFVENLSYFDKSSLYSIQGRALSSVVSHMFDSSIIAYGLIVSRYRYNNNRWFSFFFSFLLASFAHGFYDFWLINEEVSDFNFLTTLFMIFSFIVFTIFISNAINNSTFFDNKKIIEARKLNDFLFYSLSSIMLVEYLILSFSFGPSAGNNELRKSIFSGAYLIFILSSGFSNFQIRRNEWKPLFEWIYSRKKDEE